MSSSERKIKKFSDFSMQKPSCYRVSNLLAITGEYKTGLFSKKKKFEIIFYYTPVKGTIMHISANVDADFYPFKIYDNISKVRDWVKLNNYEVVIDKKRI